MNPLVSVIVPTTASPRRVPLLWRALRSLQDGQDQMVVPIVVVNGCRFVPEVLEELKGRSDIRCLYLEQGSHTNARLEGRRAVETQFFGLLDDDDEYLPGAAQLPVAALADNPSLDGVVTNGYRHENGRDVAQFATVSAFQDDPMACLMDYSWLHSGGMVFRSARVPPGYLQGPQSMELTYLALALALTRNLQFLDVPTYRWYRGTEESLSATWEYQRGAPEAILRMLALKPPRRIKRSLERKYAASLHMLSDLERQSGNYKAAWRYHLRSLTLPDGIRYLSYTRHLLRLR
jgi:hypothetical protein